MNKLFPLLLLLISCSSKPGQSDNAVQMVEFGSGGGFTGRYNTYRLDLQGNMLTSSRGDTLPVKPSEVKAVRNKLDSINFFEYSFNRPHNMTYFIEAASESDTNKVVWGDPGFELPAGIEELNKLLQSLTKKQ